MIDRTISATMHEFVRQKLDGIYAEDAIKQKTLRNNETGRGFVIPPGRLYGGLFNLQKESLRNRFNIVLDAVKEVLNANKPSYYPEIANDIKQVCDEYFPESLSEPDNEGSYTFQIAPRVVGDKERKRAELETIRHSSLCKLHTNIDLFVATMTPKEGGNMQEHPGINISSVANSFIAINSANANQVNLRINEIKPMINAIKDSLIQATDITEIERKTHLLEVEKLENELAKPGQDKSFALKSFVDGLTNVANKVGTIASSLEPLKNLIAPFLS